jgi:hypothetical protein
VAQFRARVAPRDEEHRLALFAGEADERVVGLQVEDVELVDARGHDHERPLRHLFGQRRVLDQLEQRVLEHHRALGHGHVAADFECALVGDRDAAALHVAGQIGQTRLETAAPGFEGELDRIRIGGREIGRAHRVDELAREKARLVLGLGVKARGLDHVVEQA